jgi:hypothetical protein
VKDMPNWVTWPGIGIGVLFFIWGILPNHQKIPLGPAILFIFCVAGMIGSAAWYCIETKTPSKPASDSSADIAALLKQNIDTNTGGDSFCYLLFTPSPPDSWEPLCVHVGKYPLYGVTAEIDDVDNSGFKFSNKLELGDIPPGQGASVGEPMRWNKRHAYLILYWARNGHWAQRLISRKVNGQWVYATRVEKDEGQNKKILLERIPPDFPRNQKGEIDWNAYYQLEEKELGTIKDFTINGFAKFQKKENALVYLPIIQKWVDEHYQKPGASKVIMTTVPTWDGKWAIALPPTYPPPVGGRVVNTIEPPH